MKLESVFKIDGKEVYKAGEFLGYELYQHDNHESYGHEVITFLVKKGSSKVSGRITANADGGAEGSANVGVSFDYS